MILITGSAGYIGSEICKKFEKLKINYIGIDNLKYSYKKNIYNTKKFVKTCISNNTKVSDIIKKYKQICAHISYRWRLGRIECCKNFKKS